MVCICIVQYVCKHVCTVCTICMYVQYVVQYVCTIWMYSRQEWTNKKLDILNPTPTKSCLMVGTQKIVKTFSKILLSSALYRAKKFKKYDFFRKMLVLLLQFFICNYLTAMQYTVGKNLKRKQLTHYTLKQLVGWRSY